MSLGLKAVACQECFGAFWNGGERSAQVLDHCARAILNSVGNPLNKFSLFARVAFGPVLLIRTFSVWLVSAPIFDFPGRKPPSSPVHRRTQETRVQFSPSLETSSGEI